jgi:integrase
MTTNEWVETLWQVLSVRPKTIQSYRNLYNRHLKPVIGDLRLDEMDVELMQKKLLELPPQTSRHALMLLKTIYREAVLYGVATELIPHKLKCKPVQVQQKPFLTWEQVNDVDWGRYNNQIRFLALHGLRWSEAVVITHADIRDGFVYVNRSKNGACKSLSGVRKIPYLGHFEPLPKSYKPLQKAVSMQGITVHSLRRTYAYLLKTQNVHVTTAQKLLGHSDPLMTLKVYTSVRDEEIQETGENLRNFLMK